MNIKAVWILLISALFFSSCLKLNLSGLDSSCKDIVLADHTFPLTFKEKLLFKDGQVFNYRETNDNYSEQIRCSITSTLGDDGGFSLDSWHCATEKIERDTIRLISADRAFL